MSLLANGRSTGLVVDSGHGVTRTVPVFEGLIVPHAIENMEYAGRVIDDYAKKLLLESGYLFRNASDLDILNDIKEKLCFVAKDYDAELTTALSSSEYDYVYALPDGN